jgi:thioredoxin-related protein
MEKESHMNVLSYCAVVLALSFFSTPPSHDTQWLKDYGIAIQAARLAQRPLLVVLEKPADPEQRVDVIDGSGQISELLEGYELCRVDVTTEYGQKVAASYGATQFPYSVITDTSCRNILFRGKGKFSAEMWERTLDNYKETPSSPNGKIAAEAIGQNLDNASTSLFSHDDLASAQAASRRRNRPTLVFVTMPGCFHCGRMKSETYQDRHLAKIIVRQFESVVVDQTDEPDWVYEQDVTLFPTTLVVGTSGEILVKLSGYVSANELASRLNSIGRRLLSRL